jgi:hypothetical protein
MPYKSSPYEPHGPGSSPGVELAAFSWQCRAPSIPTFVRHYSSGSSVRVQIDAIPNTNHLVVTIELPGDSISRRQCICLRIWPHNTTMQQLAYRDGEVGNATGRSVGGLYIDQLSRKRETALRSESNCPFLPGLAGVPPEHFQRTCGIPFHFEQPGSGQVPLEHPPVLDVGASCTHTHPTLRIQICRYVGAASGGVAWVGQTGHCPA